MLNKNKNSPIIPFHKGDEQKMNKKAMSIIEVMVAIFIFTLGITSLLTMIVST
jgi:type II secretory pathway pseudopilin PulG